MSDVLRLMTEGELRLAGLLPFGSNYTFLAEVGEGEGAIEVVYKPVRGERPLWDFPPQTLCKREYAAYLVSDLLGWNLVPLTIMRDGPHGEGSVQLFINHDPEQHFFNLEGDWRDALRKVALFDVVINNADRKGGHVIVGDTGKLWSIDHGIAFHEEHKLRTVIWDFAGLALTDEESSDLYALGEKLNAPNVVLQSLLNANEYMAMQRRLDKLCESAVFPHPGPGRPYPWPMV